MTPATCPGRITFREFEGRPAVAVTFGLYGDTEVVLRIPANELQSLIGWRGFWNGIASAIYLSTIEVVAMQQRKSLLAEGMVRQESLFEELQAVVGDTTLDDGENVEPNSCGDKPPAYHPGMSLGEIVSAFDDEGCNCWPCVDAMLDVLKRKAAN
ncbi:MAG: hypothetical protein V4787_11510 [Pseudomonadota bacterium]